MSCNNPVMSKNGLVPCGQCLGCRLDYAKHWAIRLMAEAHGQDCSFVTLTYDEEHLPRPPSLQKKDLQKFFKRLRRSGVKFRYFASGEYGDKKKRPHYHVAFFGIPVDDPIFLVRHYDPKKKIWFARMEAWPFGHVAVGCLTEDSANYVAGYMVKKIKGKHAKQYYSDLGIEPEFAVMSRRPGLGVSYILANLRFLRENGFLVFKGHKVALPRFFFERVFTEDERREIKEVREFETLSEAYEAFKKFDLAKWRFPSATPRDHMKQREANLKARYNLKRRGFEDV